MKILHKTDLNKWNYLFYCEPCGSELLADRDDINYAQGHQYTDVYSILCPVCDSTTYVPDEKIPKLLQLKIKARCS